MDWVKVKGLWYYIPSLSLEDKIKFGLNSEVVDELKKIQPEQKKNPVKKRKKDDD